MSAARILIADTDRAVSEMLQIRLDIAGYQPLAARSGPGALEIMRNMRPAALVLDLAIPEMDPFELLATLQKDHSRLPCSTLLIGKRLGMEEIKRAATLGVRACMVKPFSGADLLERLAKMLKPVSPERPPAGFAPGIGQRPRPPSSSDVFI